MKTMKFLSVLIALIALVSGCGINSAASYETALPSEDGATEINIEVWDVSSFYKDAAKKFEEETGVKVNVTNYYKAGQGDEDLSTNLERIQAELMAGKGADIYAGVYLNYNTIGKNDHLCNLANWISQDPDFSDETYYMNILKSEMVDGKMYSFPLEFMCQALGSTIEAPELEGKSPNWEQFFELTKGIKRSGVLYCITDYMLFVSRYKDRAEHFIDEKNKTQNLNSPEMIDLLKQCKEWSDKGLCIPENSENYSELANSAYFKEYGGDIDLLTNIRWDDPYIENDPYFYDIPSDSGENNRANKIAPTDFVCINAASKYKGTAWKFIKYLLSEDIQLSAFNTPVNRKVAEKVIRDSITETIDYCGLNLDADKAIQDTLDTVNSIDNIPSILPRPLDGIVYKEAIRFLRNEISAEEAAKNMADRTELYFKEQ